MSDDIVDRLRDKAQWMNDLGLQDEAADEIERLRAALVAISAGEVKKEIPDDDFGWFASELQNIARRALGEAKDE